MNIFKKIDESATLMGDMSSKVGVQWRDRVLADPEAVRTYRQAVMACTRCKSVGECKGWQATHESASEAPDYCMNKELLAGLAQG